MARHQVQHSFISKVVISLNKVRWIFPTAFSTAANPPMDFTLTTSEGSSTISVFWSSPIGGDAVTGYLVYYHHPNHNVTIINRTSNDLSATFTELTTTQRVYTVSIQALSEHLPSIVVGPVTARSKFLEVYVLDTPFVFALKCILYAHSFVIPAPSPVQGLVVVSVMERKLNISWEEPAEPNDYTLNYTVTITDISTGTELSRTVILDMDKDKFTILTDTIGMIDVIIIILSVLRFRPVSVEGVPYNVTVFATNGRGRGPNVSKVAYAEGDFFRLNSGHYVF